MAQSVLLEALFKRDAIPLPVAFAGQHLRNLIVVPGAVTKVPKNGGLLALTVFCAFAQPALAADNLPSDVQAYVDRRTGCNYWPSETAKSKLRRAEIARNVRALNCPTLDHEEAMLQARYQRKPELLQAIADAHDAMPD
jgi:hypothetical protein